MIQDPRHIALNVLLTWHSSSHTLDLSLEKHAETISSLSKKDKNLCNALIFGVLRHQSALDWIIRPCSNTPFEKIKPFALYLLRIALIQMIHMDRVPVFAAIDTAVNIAKKNIGKKGAGYINAVLRNAADNSSKMTFPDKRKDPTKFISIKYSMPLWLVKKWKKNFGLQNTSALCEQISTIPKITLRTNTLKTNRHILLDQLTAHVKTIELTTCANQGIQFTGPDTSIHEMEAFKQGLFQIQDEAAQIVTQFMAPKPGENILDACAGLGGKTGHIAQLMNNTGTLVAIDIETKKLELLDIEAKRLGIDIIQTKPVDVLKTSIKDFDTYFDRVLIDAPCTGLGVLRRNPDTKWKRSKNDIERLAAKQKKMINAAANLVKPGGLLIFAVCSCEKEENEDVIQAFLSKRKDFSIEKNFQSDRCRILMTPEGYLKTYPAVNDMDGFFAARLKRKPKG